MKMILFFLICVPLHIKIAQSYIGTTELTGHNDGVNVEKFLRSVGLSKGNPWCAAFVSNCLIEAGVREPSIRTALARKFITKQSIKASDVLIGKVNIKPGTIVVWQKGNTVFGHVGFIEKQIDKQNFITIEGNTSSGIKGSQSDGDGVYRRSRAIQPANYFRITAFTLVKKG